MSKFPTTERCSLACFITLHAFLFFPSPSLDFEKLSREMARDVTAPKKRGIPVDKKIFSTRYQRRGILDVGWQRSHGALNIFSVCLSGAKISRSSRRVLLGFKKKKKEIRALLSPFPSLFFPAPFFFFFHPLPIHPFPFRRVHGEEDFDGDSCRFQPPLQLSRYFTQRRRRPSSF